MALEETKLHEMVAPRALHDCKSASPVIKNYGALLSLSTPKQNY